tara:strand:- start:64439 stop:64957 length:519 start_codon:yes stop_codon:yes gene_type:complete
MKHIKLYEQFINEARAIPLTLEPGDFEKAGSIWGYYQYGDRGNTWRVHSDYFIDMEKGNDPYEQDVVFLEYSEGKTGGLMKTPDSKKVCYLKIGLINNLKRQSASTYGKNFKFFPGEDIDKVSKEAAKFLFDKEHFKWLNKNIKAEGKKLRVVPKGDFSGVIKKLLQEANFK